MDEERAETPAEEATGDPAAIGLPDAAPEPKRPDPSEVSLRAPLLVLLVPIAVLALGSILFPDTVWDKFVYKYYWAPIVTDEGFNPVNTLSWAVLMGALLFLAARIVQKIEQPITFTFILAVVPYIMAGSVTRVLEDTGYFVTPLRYLFITPIIYVVITALATLWLVVGYRLRVHAKQVGVDAPLLALGAFFAVLWLLLTLWGHFGDDLAHPPSPILTFLAFAVPYAYFWNYTRQRGEISQGGVMATAGMVYVIVMVYMVILWHTGPQWGTLVDCDLKPAPCRDSGFGDDMRGLVYIAMIVAPAVFTALVYYIAKARLATKEIGSDTWQSTLVFLAPINLLIVFAQMMDATMTSLGIDFYGYSEKHVLPEALIRWMSANGPGIFGEYAATTVMMTLKFAVALAVIWAIDVYAKKDMEDHPDLVGLAKLAIIMVGLAPGTRDAVRLAMDV